MRAARSLPIRCAASRCRYTFDEIGEGAQGNRHERHNYLENARALEQAVRQMAAHHWRAARGPDLQTPVLPARA